MEVVRSREKVSMLVHYGFSLTDDAGNSITKCMTEFGFTRKTFNDARMRGAVSTRCRWRFC